MGQSSIYSWITKIRPIRFVNIFCHEHFDEQSPQEDIRQERFLKNVLKSGSTDQESLTLKFAPHLVLSFN